MTLLDTQLSPLDELEPEQESTPPASQTHFADFIAALGDHTIDTTTVPGLLLYKSTDDQIFAIIHDATTPLRLEAKCDPQLARLLRDRYESVLPSTHMDKKSWNEIINSGQLTTGEIQDLLVLSYNLITNPPTNN